MLAIDLNLNLTDMSAGLQITGWPAHDSAISSILFGPDETSIFSLGSDGKASIFIFHIFFLFFINLDQCSLICISFEFSHFIFVWRPDRISFILLDY